MLDPPSRGLISKKAPKFLLPYLDAVDGATLVNGNVPEFGAGYLICALWRGERQVGEIQIVIEGSVVAHPD